VLNGEGRYIRTHEFIFDYQVGFVGFVTSFATMNRPRRSDGSSSMILRSITSIIGEVLLTVVPRFLGAGLTVVVEGGIVDMHVKTKFVANTETQWLRRVM